MPERSFVVVAPDSFKGSLSAPDAAAAIAAGVARGWPGASTHIRPMADGGEGTLDAVLAAVGAAGRRAHVRVTGAGGDPIDAAYGVITRDDGITAVLEAAQVVGITDAAGMSVPVAQRSTRGLGELVKHLLDAGIRRFMVGLGGSSTNDGGSGLLSALGVALIGDTGAPINPTPSGLPSLARITLVELVVHDSRGDHQAGRGQCVDGDAVVPHLSGEAGGEPFERGLAHAVDGAAGHRGVRRADRMDGGA